MVKLMAFLKRRPDLSFEQFAEHWAKVHCPMAVECLPQMRKYVQNLATPSSGREWPYDGVSEVWFDSMADYKAAFKSPLAAKVMEDEKAFLGTVDWMIVTENTVLEASSRTV